MSEMDIVQACDELAKRIIDRNVPFSGGCSIQFFCEAIKDGETPMMALAIATSDNADQMEFGQ